MKKNYKITIQIVLGILLIPILFSIVLNILERTSCKEFYSLKQNVCKNPGLWQNAIPQGLTYNDDENYFATSCYMSDRTESRIYTINKETNVTKKYKLRYEGKKYTGHVGGLQYANGKFYLAAGNDGVFIIDSSILKDNKYIDLDKPVKLFCKCSFCFADKNYLYAGEFSRTPFYVCNHPISYNENHHNGIVCKYDLNDLSSPAAIFSIPDNVQGFAVDDDGNYYLSISWALSHSKYYVYKADSVSPLEFKYIGKELYFLDKPDKILQGPFFSEDLDIYDGKLLSLNESACNSYVIGKFLFDFNIFSLPLKNLLN